MSISEVCVQKNLQKSDCENVFESATLLESVKLDTKHQDSKWSRTLKFAAYGSTIGTSLPVGYVVGSINSPAVYIREWCNETLIVRYDAHLSEGDLLWLWSLIVSVFLVGGVVGSLIGASLANKYGRLLTLYICGFLLAISAACFYFCRLIGSVELLFIGRAVSGLACGINISHLPMYHSELALVEHRGTLGVFCPIGITAGVVVGQIFSLQPIFGNEELWHIALSAYIVPIIIVYAPYKLYPESPKWLYVMCGKRDAAEEELKRLRPNSNSLVIEEELKVMDSEINQKSKQVSSFQKVLRDRKLRLPLIIVCAFHGGQQLSGITAIFFYSVPIFLKAGLTQEEASLANLCSGLLNFTMSLFGPYLMRKFDRRPLMMLSSIFCAFFLFLFGILFQYMDLVSWFSKASLSCMFLYILFYQLGIRPIPYFIGSELFEVAPRPVAMSLGGFSSTFCNFVIAMTFPTLENHWGGFVFMPFSLSCLLLFLLTKYYLPETRGRDPSEISQLVANGFKSKVQVPTT